MTSTYARALEILAIAISQNLTDQFIAIVDVKADGHFGMIDVLRPAFDQVWRGPIHMATQRAD